MTGERAGYRVSFFGGLSSPLGSNARLISSCSSTARSLRWQGEIYSGLAAICAVLAEFDSSLRPSRG